MRNLAWLRGLRSQLSRPKAFDLFEVLASANRGVYFDILRDVAARFENPRVLDVGCGTGRVLSFLPAGARYDGYDLNARYIDAARRKFGDRGTFTCADVEKVPIAEGSYDLVTAFGLLHHVDDEKCLRFFALARACLKPGGALITADGCFCENQPPLARLIVSLDRGRHVRWPPQYEALARSKFTDVSTTLAQRKFPLPHTSFTMVCRR